MAELQPKPSGRYANVKIEVADTPITDHIGGKYIPEEENLIKGLRPAGKASKTEPKQGVVAPMVFDEKGGDQD